VDKIQSIVRVILKIRGARRHFGFMFKHNFLRFYI